MATGSSPDKRSASRLSLADSTVKDRCTAKMAVKTTATQNNPAVKRRSVALSPSSANPNSTSTVTANGAIWVNPTRDRRSMRRSFPAMRVISPHIGHPRYSGDSLRGSPAGARIAVGHHRPAGDGDRTRRHGPCPFELVGRDDDGRAARGRITHELVDGVSPVLIETG